MVEPLYQLGFDPAEAAQPPLDHLKEPEKPVRMAERSVDRRIVPQSIADKLASRPVTTAVFCALAGALLAEGIALLVTRARSQAALRRAATSNLRMAERLDSHRERARHFDDYDDDPLL